MNHRQRLALVVAVAAALTLAFGSAGFTSVSAQRGVSVAVVDDDEAFVGYQERSDATVLDGQRIDLVTVTNRFPSDVVVTGVTIDPAGAITDVSTPALDVGESRAIEGNVSCESGQETIEVTVTVDGRGVWARIYGDTTSRTFELDCADVDDPRFMGGGNFAMDATGIGTTPITYWTYNKSSDTFDAHETSFDPARTLQPQAGGQTKIVAVYLEEYGVTYVHPKLNVKTKTISNWGSGGADAKTVQGRIWSQ